MFSNNPFSAKIKAVSDEIVSQSRCWTNAQVVKTGVVDQMTSCQADGLDTIEYCTHVKMF